LACWEALARPRAILWTFDNRAVITLVGAIALAQTNVTHTLSVAVVRARALSAVVSTITSAARAFAIITDAVARAVSGAKTRRTIRL